MYYFFMKKYFMFILIAILALSVRTAWAGGFNLKSIGQVNTSGRQISHWWYSGSTPVMIGEAVAGSTVTISIDGTENTVTADGSGNWTYNPGSLADGDHAVILKSDGSTITFTLTMGANNVNWDAVGSGSGETLPAAGVAWPTIILLSSGGMLFLVAKKLRA